MAKDAYRETLRCISHLQSIFDFLEEKLQISQDHDMLDGRDWEYRTANSLHVTNDQFESFHAKVAKPILKTSSAEVIRLTIDIGKTCDRGWYHTTEHSPRYLDMADGGTNAGIANGTNNNS